MSGADGLDMIRGMSLDLAALTSTDFLPCTGQEFVVAGASPLRLDAVRSDSRDAPGARSPFALEFSAAHDGYLPQGTYALRHEVMGLLELFLVPLGPDPAGRMRYEAVFG